jgi:hypothetical protein
MNQPNTCRRAKYSNAGWGGISRVSPPSGSPSSPGGKAKSTGYRCGATMFLVDDYVGRELEEHCHTVTHEEDEEMAGELRIADSAAYLYQLDGRYVIGVHGAGWDFYDGVWDVLYDLMGYQWHEETRAHKREYISGDGDDG